MKVTYAYSNIIPYTYEIIVLMNSSLALNFKKSDSTVKNLQNETQEKLMVSE